MQNSISLAWLIGNEGTPGEIRFELTKSESILGRGSDCEVQVDDKLASRKHAVIYYRDGGFEIEDLGSSNGTFVNNKTVTSAKPLPQDPFLMVIRSPSEKPSSNSGLNWILMPRSSR